MSNILLIEPNYKNKYPPLGLMKISYFHRKILHDYVRFTKGPLPDSVGEIQWDHVYVTTLFTFEWAETIKAINYAKTLVDDLSQITVGGIAATLLPDDIYEETGIHPCCGLLNEPGKLGLPGDECIDGLIPDYSILDDIDYNYPFHDAYFLSATKGCGMNCGFCAVKTLEPTYIPYMDIKQKIAAINSEFGPKKDLLLMDNNVLRSQNFDQIIDDIIASGFGKGATYISPKTGKRVKRHVDFNQGLDGNLFTEEKAKRLGEIELRPARIAFDHIEDRDTYERALRLCAKYGINELSNYVLYNSEDFDGKGKKYQADTPENLYERMRITLDIRDDLNKDRDEKNRVHAFSFPMRYIPLNAHERGYIGSHWNAKYLRSVQCMLIPTQGKGVGSRSFFEADFGRSAEEFVRFLAMPERMLQARGHFVEKLRKDEALEDFENRKSQYLKNQRAIAKWGDLFDSMDDDERSQFIALIGDNEYVPEKFFTMQTEKQKKLYLFYLTIPRTFALLGLINRNSPTYALLKSYIREEFPEFYQELLAYLATSDSQQQYIFRNFMNFFGKSGVNDLLMHIKDSDFDADSPMKRWDAVCKKDGIWFIDFELIRIYRRFVEIEVLTEKDHEQSQDAIADMDMMRLAQILNENMTVFQKRLLEIVDQEKGKSILESLASSIFENMQLKLESFLEM